MLCYVEFIEKKIKIVLTRQNNWIVHLFYGFYVLKLIKIINKYFLKYCILINIINAIKALNCNNIFLCTLEWSMLFTKYIIYTRLIVQIIFYIYFKDTKLISFKIHFNEAVAITSNAYQNQNFYHRQICPLYVAEALC